MGVLHVLYNLISDVSIMVFYVNVLYADIGSQIYHL